MMMIAEKEEYLKKNKHITQVLTGLNIVASTGSRTMKTDSGFKDVLLKRNAKKIYAVDVGTNQLNEKIKNNPKVISLEKTNARYLVKEMFDELIQLVVSKGEQVLLVFFDHLKYL